MQIQLTIGAAIYNIEEPILRAFIEGAARQLTDETELLLIDDCSITNSGDICREYAAANSHVRYIRMEQNGGLSRVRNRTIAEAAGKWILFADGDDLLSDHFVETALRFCDADDDIIIYERLKFTEEKQAEQPCTVTDLIHLPTEAGRELSISCLCLDPTVNAKFNLPSRAFFHAAWGALYQKAFLLKNNLQFPDGQKKAQDSVFNTWTYFYAKTISYLPYIMYYYRNNAQGITHRFSADLPQVMQSLLRHHQTCIETLFPGDKDVEKRFRSHRLIANIIDNLRLNLFHKNNLKSRKQRKEEFFAFIGSEPYKTAIQYFDARESGRWEWNLPIKLVRAKRFGLLDLFVGNDTAFRLLCGADKRIEQMLHKK